VPPRGMARLGSAGGATLQRSKLDLKQETKTLEPKLDDGMGGGNNGKNIHNGGGGDNDGGDDDDYFDNFDGGDGEGDDGAFFRTVIEQLYDRRSINAVLQEWFRTLESLPAILRGSVEMGLFSSAQLVRFLSMDVRPGVARAVTRSLPPQASFLPAPSGFRFCTSLAHAQGCGPAVHKNEVQDRASRRKSCCACWKAAGHGGGVLLRLEGVLCSS
jgi:hypothetical protein